MKDSLRYLKFLLEPFLRFPLNTEGAHGAVAVSILWIGHLCVYIYACFSALQEFLAVQKDESAQQLQSLMLGCCLVFSWILTDSSSSSSLSLLLSVFAPMVSFSLSPSHITFV